MTTSAFSQSSRLRRTLKLALASALPVLLSPLGHSETWTPTATGSYDWNTAGSWGGVSFPNSTGATANITADFAGAQTINLNENIIVGSLTINDSGATADSAVTIATGTPGGSLTFTPSSGSALITSSSSGITNTISTDINFGSNNVTINQGSATSSSMTTKLALSGALSGSGVITVTGTSTNGGKSLVELSGSNNAFTGTWALDGSSSNITSYDQGGAGLLVNSDAALGAVPASATTQINVLKTSALQLGAGVTLNANRGVSVSSGATLILIATSAVTGSEVAGSISGAGNLLINSGTNRVMILSGNNTYSGTTTIRSGTLRTGSTTALSSNSALALTGTLNLAGFSNSIGSLSGTGGVTLGSATLTTGGLNANTTYSGVISGTGGFTKTGSGVQTLSGDNTYSGATTVNGGTLAIGAADRIANASDMVLGGGTFVTGGFNETLDTLTVNANSTIDFGAGASALVFSASNAIAWSGTLTLLNFDIGTDSLKFGTSFSALSLAQLDAISLAGYTASLDSGGFVVFSAIPEPSTYAALLGAAGLTLAVARRSRIRRG